MSSVLVAAHRGGRAHPFGRSPGPRRRWLPPWESALKINSFPVFVAPPCSPLSLSNPVTSALAPDWERQEGRKGGEALGAAAPPGTHVCGAGEAGRSAVVAPFSIWESGFGVSCRVGSMSWGPGGSSAQGWKKNGPREGAKGLPRGFCAGQRGLRYQ